MNDQYNKKCPDCGVLAGCPHEYDCDVERCSICGSQRILCICDDHDPMKAVWTGQFPKKKNVERSLELKKDERIDFNARQCYYNCFKTIHYCPEHSQTSYVEGMSIVYNGLMIEHGWLEVENEILDPTLPTEDVIYFPGLRFVGELGFAEAIRIPKPDYCEDFPIFYRFGWGGTDSPEFMEAREAASRWLNLKIELNSQVTDSVIKA